MNQKTKFFLKITQMFYSKTTQVNEWRVKKEMPSAYVLFTVSPGFEDAVLNAARKTGEVEEAFVSYGAYDLIVKAKADSMDELKELVSYKLRTIANVTSTLTLMIDQENKIKHLEVPLTH
jgi:DNA-binding Lrp family transcriptional regulator